MSHQYIRILGVSGPNPLLYTGARMRVCVTERKQTLKTNLHEVKKGFAKLRSLI